MYGRYGMFHNNFKDMFDGDKEIVNANFNEICRGRHTATTMSIKAPSFAHPILREVIIRDGWPLLDGSYYFTGLVAPDEYDGRLMSQTEHFLRHEVAREIRGIVDVAGNGTCLIFENTPSPLIG